MACFIALHLFFCNRLLILCFFFYNVFIILFLNSIFLDYTLENWVYSFFCTFVDNKLNFFSFFFIFIFSLNYFGKSLYFNLLLTFFSDFTIIDIKILNDIINFNLSLFNGLLLLHPFLLFLAYSIMLIIIFYYFFFIIFSKSKLTLSNFIISYLTSFLIPTIILGALWAQQELNWGGWWSWDIIELGSLFWIVFLITAMHFKYYNVNFIFTHNFFLVFFIFFYLGVRFSFFDSIHSFVSDNITDFKGYNYFYIILNLFLLGYFKNSIPKNFIYFFVRIFLTLITFIVVADFVSKYYFITFCNIEIYFFLIILSVIFLLTAFKKFTFYFYGFIPFFLNFLNLLYWKPRSSHFLFFILLFSVVILKFNFFQESFYNHAVFNSLVISKHHCVTVTEFSYFIKSYFILNNVLFKKGFLFITASTYLNFNEFLLQVDVLNNVISHVNNIFILYNYLIDSYNLITNILCLSFLFLFVK